MNYIGFDFQRIGCTDQLKCSLGARVFTDLTLDKGYLVEKCYDKSLGVVYLRAQHPDQFTDFVLPFLHQHDLNFRLIGEFQCKVLARAEFNNLMLAICDTSSNISYYNVGYGFLEKLC